MKHSELNFVLGVIAICFLSLILIISQSTISNAQVLGTVVSGAIGMICLLVVLGQRKIEED